MLFDWLYHIASLLEELCAYYYDELFSVCVFVVFNSIEDYCPGFKGLVVGKEVLTPPDLERIFGLTGGVRLTILTVQH